MSDPAPHPASLDEPGPDAGGGRPVPVPARPAQLPLPRGEQAPAPQANGFALSLAPETISNRARSIPILGGLAAIFGVCALFKAPLVLGPLAILFALGALLRRQVSLGAIGGVAGLVGLLISPLFWTLIGLGWLGGTLWNWVLG